MIALNATKGNADDRSDYWMERFRRTCNGNKCFDSMMYLMGHLLENLDYKTSTGCDFVGLTKEKNVRQKVQIYPCYRD